MPTCPTFVDISGGQFDDFLPYFWFLFFVVFFVKDLDYFGSQNLVNVWGRSRRRVSHNPAYVLSHLPLVESSWKSDTLGSMIIRSRGLVRDYSETCSLWIMSIMFGHLWRFLANLVPQNTTRHSLRISLSKKVFRPRREPFGEKGLLQVMAMSAYVFQHVLLTPYQLILTVNLHFESFWVFSNKALKIHEAR